MTKKKPHHDIESVIEEHASKEPEIKVKRKRASSKNPGKKSKLKTQAAKEKSEDLPKSATAAEKKEFIEDKLEEIGEAIEEEVDEKLDEAEEDTGEKQEEPVAVFVKDKETVKDIGKLKKAVANGFETTQKNMVVFYERTADAGDRFKGLLYILLGLSIIFTASFVSQQNLFTLVDFLKIMSRTIVGKIITISIGVSFMAYGYRRFSTGLFKRFKNFLFPKPKPKYVQKKLV